MTEKSPLTFNVPISNEFDRNFRESLYESGEFSDVTFEIGPGKKFKAHKLVLMAASEKFRTILKEQTSNISLPDMDPNAFEQLLRCIYLHKFEIYDPKSAVNCFKVFQDFGFSLAAKVCDEYLNNPENVTLENVLVMYEASNIFSLGLINECIKLFFSNTLEILQSDNFLEANYGTVRTIFSLSEMKINSELDLLDALYRYSKKNVGNEDEIQACLSQIRLLTLTPEELLRSEAVHALLTNDQIVAILANHNIPDNPFYKMPEGFSISRENRGKIKENVESASQLEIKRLNQEIERLNSIANNMNNQILEKQRQQVDMFDEEIQTEVEIDAKDVQIEKLLQEIKDMMEKIDDMTPQIKQENQTDSSNKDVDLDDDDVIFVENDPIPVIEILNDSADLENSIPTITIHKESAVDPLQP